jgi:hypothetical protein
MKFFSVRAAAVLALVALSLLAAVAVAHDVEAGKRKWTAAANTVRENVAIESNGRAEGR